MTFNPGLYVLDGTGTNVNGSSTVFGDDVSYYLTEAGGVDLQFTRDTELNESASIIIADEVTLAGDVVLGGCATAPGNAILGNSLMLQATRVGPTPHRHGQTNPDGAQDLVTASDTDGMIRATRNDGSFSLIYVEVTATDQVGLLFAHPGKDSPRSVASTSTLRVR